MKRLTERDEYGNADIIALDDVMPEIYAELSFDEANGLTDALNRLADYEDTGLMPEDIKELCTDDVADVAKLFRRLIEDGSIDHIQELLAAEAVQQEEGKRKPSCHTCGHDCAGIEDGPCGDDAPAAAQDTTTL